MATAFTNDEEDFVTCGVCLCEFDAENRKPKFLQCSHTVCLQCVKEICRGGSVTCPFCRNTFVQSDVIKLPNNFYALHMIKFLNDKKREPVLVAAASSALEVNWCLTCGLAEKASCAPWGHSLINMPANTIRNLEARLTLQEELLKLKDRGTDKLAMAVQKRKQIQEYLSLILKSIKAAENEIVKQQDENNLRLTEMVSILERKSVSTTDPCYLRDEKTGVPFTLLDLVDDASPDDTAEELKVKMTNVLERYEQMLSEATAVASQYDLFHKTKISVLLCDENDGKIPTCRWLENGFSLDPAVSPVVLKGPVFKQDLMLISHAVFSFLKRQNIELKSVQKQPTIAAQSSSVADTTKNVLWSLPPTVSSNNKFTLDQGTFILRLFQSGSPKGEIHIRPAPTFHPLFVQKLGDFCYKSQKSSAFTDIVEKGMKEVFVSLSMKLSKFKPVVPSMTGEDPDSHKETIAASRKALCAGEVGVAFVTTSACNSKVIDWTFIFPLEKFQDYKYEEHVRNEEDNELFGSVVHEKMLFSIVKLSSTRNAEREDYTMTIESR